MTTQSEHLSRATRATALKALQELEALQAERDAWRRLAEARADLLTCYRIGVGSGDRRAESALSRIDIAKGELRRLGVEVQP